MKKSSIALALTLFFATSAYAGELAVTYRAQQKSYWCWAGSSQMVAEFIRRTTYRQCDMVNLSLGIRNACTFYEFASDIDPSDQPQYTTNLPRLLGNYGVPSSYTNGSVSAATVISKINANKPFIVVWRKSGFDHAVVVSGYVNGTGTSNPTLAIKNPWPAGRWGYEGGSYYNTYNSMTGTWLETVTPN